MSIDIDVDELSRRLECPVSFNVPRDLPIAQCSMGQITCKKCKATLIECPTCGRELFKDFSSSIYAWMIEQIPHKCKYNHLGCQTQEFLKDILEHEKLCEFRLTIPFHAMTIQDT